MDLSVIIVNYNVRHFLEQCLHSVRKAREAIDCEIFVVDNNSVDGSCSMISQQFPEVRLIRNLYNVGFSKATNQAIRFARGKYILLLNPDTVVEEDTFIKCINFMIDHPDAGALGVKMIDGKGRLLPESKRALPTPRTAFFKISGLSYLFPKSHLFNKYYLAHINSSETSKAEIISGAFMFIRREVLYKTGFLDEKFFMYGEDIDLSYRLIKAGYTNYYYPDVKIIHYKGQSTKKGDLNVVLHFYAAMIIFAKKHFENSDQKTSLFFIQIAIYFCGFFTLCKKLFRKLFLPIADAGFLYLLFIKIIHLWERYKFGGEYTYPDLFLKVAVPAYAVAIVLAVFFMGGYRLPSQIMKAVKGIIIGTTIIYVIYAFLPQEFRFSRAVVFLGGIIAMTIIPVYRYLLALTGLRIVENPFPMARRTIIVGDDQGLINIKKIIANSGLNNIIIGRVSIKPEDMGPEVLGNIGQLKEVIRINRINEVIFSTRGLTASQIINSMYLLSNYNVLLKIAPVGEKFIIGSDSDKKQDALYPIDKPLFKQGSALNKRTYLFK